MNIHRLVYMVCAPVLLLQTGCQHHDWESHDLQQEEFTARRLYQPLVSGQKELLARMPNVLDKPLAFDLSSFPVRLIDGGIEQSQYWDEDKAVFFDIDADPNDAEHEWVYFNPRRTRVERVHFNDHDLFPIYRALPEGRRKKVRQRDLDIFKVNFRLIPLDAPGRQNEYDDTTIDFFSTCQLTFDGDPEAMPVFTENAETMVYLATRELERHKLRHQLMVKRLDTMPDPNEPDTAMPVIEGQVFDVRFPRMLPDGRLSFAANIDGPYRMYQIDHFEDWDFSPIKPETLQRLRYPIPSNEGDDQFIFGTMGKEGVPMPVLLKLPERYDLPTLLTMLEVYNPRVNEKRALLAAALIEAQIPKLNNWPVLSAGLSYEEAVDIFFDIPRIAAGDTLSQEVANLLIGFTQPLLNYRRNAALSEAGMWQARVAADLVDYELNERIAEAATLYFEATYLEALLGIQAELNRVNDQKSEFYQALRAQGEAIRLQLMAVEQNRVGNISEQHFSEERLAFLKSRLKEVCGIPEKVSLLLSDDEYRLTDLVLPTQQELRDVAQLNHPRINIAQHTLSRSFYLRAAGHSIRPSLDLIGTYNASDRNYQRVAGNVAVDDNRENEILSIGLGARYPTASGRAKKYHRGYWDHLINAQQLLRDAEIRNVDTQLNEAYLDFKTAQWDYQAKSSTHAYTGEKLRVTRAQNAGTPAGGLESASDIFRDFNVSDAQGRFDQLSPYAVRMEFLNSYAQRLKVEMDLGLRYINLMREQGIAYTAAQELVEHRAEKSDRLRPSLWLWETTQVLSGDARLDAFVRTVKEMEVKRVYVYLGAQSEVLSNPASRERFTLLLHLCREQGTQVWALLGEPEWLTASDTNELNRALKDIQAFNARFEPYEPLIAGVKLDLEPHSLPEWSQHTDQRPRLMKQYLSVLQAARTQLNGSMPLWADLSVKFFKDDGIADFHRIEPLLDGATVMTYFNTDQAIFKWARIADSLSELPLEFGLEYSSNAPPGDRISDWSLAQHHSFKQTFLNEMYHTQSFAGIALHDYTGLSRLPHGEQP